MGHHNTWTQSSLICRDRQIILAEGSLILINIILINNISFPTNMDFSLRGTWIYTCIPLRGTKTSHVKAKIISKLENNNQVSSL